MASEAEWKAELDASPADWFSRLIYADWLDENGETNKAYLQRWLVKHQIHPMWSSSGDKVGWGWRNKWHDFSPMNLPYGELSAALNKGRKHWPYASRREAEEALLAHLDLIRTIEDAGPKWLAEPRELFL